MNSKVLVLLSDLHVGASTGLLPPKFTSFEGNPIAQNPYQKWLWKCWQDCWKWADKVIGSDNWIACLNGDLIDGNHHQTREIISSDVADHFDGALQCLSDVLKPASAVYLTEGTNVHTNNSEHGIAKVLEWRGVKVKSPNNRKAAWPEITIRVHGCFCTIDHHVATTTKSYLEAGAYSTTMGDLRNRRSRAGWEIPKFVVRSHRHQFGMWSDGYGTMVVLPPWQGSGRFVRRVVTGAVPQCGMVIADWRNVPFGSPPVLHSRIHTVTNSPSFL